MTENFGTYISCHLEFYIVIIKNTFLKGALLR